LLYVVKRITSWVVKSFTARSVAVRPHFTFLGPLFEIFNDVIFREVATFSVMMDIYRGMPAIYVAYTGYDEIAHHFGADSKEAFRSLRGIDKQIHQIERMRQLYVERDYDLYVLSDHGMTPSEPFVHAYGQTLRDFIAEHTGQEVRTGEGRDETEGLPEARVQFMLDEIRGLEARPHRPLPSQLLRATRQHLEERLMAEALAAGWDLSRRGDIVARNSGSLSHVYFNVALRPMDLSEVVLLHSSLLESLVDHDGIGLVVGREGQEVVITGRAGTLRIGPETRRLEGENPLAHLSDPEWAAQQIARVARFPHAGDLILLGAWDGKRVISFEEQVASHGGLGGPQTWPFIAFPPQERFLVRGIENSEEVYTRLVGIHGGYN
jgi:hypothetical protein